MKRSVSAIRQANASLVDTVHKNESINEIKYLSEDPDYLIKDPILNDDIPIVPPSTPESGFSFNHEIETLPEFSRKLEDLELPIVRDVGVKGTIRQLASHLGFESIHVNLLQFWFLDLLTDCIWRMQDEYSFPQDYQKIVLEWVIYVFDLIKDPTLNLSRKQLFRVFCEAVSVAEKYVESGETLLTVPENIFTEIFQNEEESFECSSDESDSSISLSDDESNSNKSLLAVNFDEESQIFKLPRGTCVYNDECLSSSIETLSEDSYCLDEETDSLSEKVAETKKNTGIVLPSRFLSESKLNRTVEKKPVISFISSDLALKDYEWKDVKKSILKDCIPPEQPTTEKKPSKERKRSTRDSLTFASIKLQEKIEQEKEEKVLTALFQYHIWQQRLENMNDPKVGWVPNEEEEEVLETKSDNQYDDMILEEWKKYLTDFDENVRKSQQNLFINMCAILAIKQFVFDYFYESFQFLAIKLAYRCPHFYTIQTLNKKWWVPKRFKSELKRPVPRKPKKEPTIKPPKPVEKKEDKKSKEESKETVKDKEVKKDEEIKPVLTKEELERLRLEQEMLEEKMMKDAENVVYMFPLGDAVKEQFFRRVFRNYAPPEEKKGKNEKKKK